jgi:ATP adenylyltransferase
MEYIGLEQPSGCIFCEKPRQRADREQLILFRGSAALIMLNLFPYNNGHLLIAPYRHTADLPGLTDAEGAELMALTGFSLRLLDHALHPAGYNLGMNLGKTAGAGVPDHLHLHIVPRWDGDTNFMPVVAGTKVMPQAIFDSYDRLLAAGHELGWPGGGQGNWEMRETGERGTGGGGGDAEPV